MKGVNSSKGKLKSIPASWLFFNVIFPLIPFILKIYFLGADGKLSFYSAIDGIELIFFSIILSVAIVNDLYEIYGVDSPKNWMLLAFIANLVLNCVICGAIYSNPMKVHSVTAMCLAIVTLFIGLGAKTHIVTSTMNLPSEPLED